MNRRTLAGSLAAGALALGLAGVAAVPAIAADTTGPAPAQLGAEVCVQALADVRTTGTTAKTSGALLDAVTNATTNVQLVAALKALVPGSGSTTAAQDALAAAQDKALAVCAPAVVTPTTTMPAPTTTTPAPTTTNPGPTGGGEPTTGGDTTVVLPPASGGAVTDPSEDSPVVTVPVPSGAPETGA